MLTQRFPTHLPSTSLQTRTTLIAAAPPYITLLLDLNVDSDPQLSATYLKRDPSHPETGQCLRIYASGMSDTTFPFLNQHPPVAKGLQEILSRQKEAPIPQALRSSMRNMRWEA